MNEKKFSQICERIFRQLDRIEYYSMIGAIDVLDIGEAAFITGLAKSTVYQLCCSHEIPHYKRGKALMFDKKELQVWLKAVKVGDFSIPTTLSNQETETIAGYETANLSLSRKEAQQIMLSEIKALASILKAEQSALVDQEVEILMNKLRLTT